jgi:hypothetical protein
MYYILVKRGAVWIMTKSYHEKP